jgi:pimeloyl-ACP methyl ester carboxylesterase
MGDSGESGPMRRRRIRARPGTGLMLGLMAWIAPGLAVTAGAPEAVTAPEHVVLLHGMARTDRSMAPLAERIARGGYRVFNVGYPGRELPPDELVAVLRGALDECCADADRLHFVTHSLGGILVRAHLAETPDPRVGRVVMMSPPNQGTDLVDLLGETWLFRTIMGPTAAQMGTGPGDLPSRLPPANFELGIIAATGSINPFGSLLIRGEDDGIVPLCRMWLEGATDTLIVSNSHSLMMHSKDVSRQVLAFLENGRFEHAEDAPPADLPRECEPADQ